MYCCFVQSRRDCCRSKRNFTKPFKIENSVRRGFPISPFWYALALEVLLQKLEVLEGATHDVWCRRWVIANAGDTSIIVSDEGKLPCVDEALRRYEGSSEAKVNKFKFCQVTWFFSWPFMRAEVWRLSHLVSVSTATCISCGLKSSRKQTFSHFEVRPRIIKQQRSGSRRDTCHGRCSWDGRMLWTYCVWPEQVEVSFVEKGSLWPRVRCLLFDSSLHLRNDYL